MNQIKTKTQIVTIGGVEIPMRISGATPILYRNEFKKDMLVSMNELNKIQVDGETMMIPEGALDSILELAFIMAKQGDSTMKKSFVDWLEDIPFDSILDGSLADAIMKMFNGDSETIVEEKKKVDQQSE